MDELKPCPFCGQKAERTPISGSVCCPVRGIGKHTDYLRPDVWQNRPIEDALQKRVEELEMNVSALRSMNKRLVEDGVRLYKAIIHARIMFINIEVESDKKYAQDVDNSITAHCALMKEIGG